MKNKFVIPLVFVLLVAALGGVLLLRGKTPEQPEPDAPWSVPGEESPAEVVHVRLNMNNFFDYFEYYEERGNSKTGEGAVTSVHISYGYRLKEGLQAAQGYEHDLKLRFHATGVVNEGSYTVDFDTLQYSGETVNVQTVDIDEELRFWAKGNRTSLWQYGAYTPVCISYIENMSLTSVSGGIYLKAA